MFCQRNATFKGKEPNTLNLHARPKQRRLCFRHASMTSSWKAPLALVHSVLGMTVFFSWKATNLLTSSGTTWDLLWPRFHVDAKSISIMDQWRLRLTPRITRCQLPLNYTTWPSENLMFVHKAWLLIEACKDEHTHLDMQLCKHLMSKHSQAHGFFKNKLQWWENLIQGSNN